MNVKKGVAGITAAFLAIMSVPLPLTETRSVASMEAAASDSFPELSIEQKTLTVSEAAGQTVTLDVYLDSPELSNVLMMLQYDERLENADMESLMTKMSFPSIQNHDNYMGIAWSTYESYVFNEAILRITATLPDDVQPGDFFGVEYLPVSPFTGAECIWTDANSTHYEDALVYTNGGIHIVEDEEPTTEETEPTTEPTEPTTEPTEPTEPIDPTKVLKTVTVDGCNYDLYADHAEITGGTDSGITSLVIPDEVEGLPVTSIGEWAFYNYKLLADVTFPDTIINVCHSAFSGSTLETETPWLKAQLEENGYVIIGKVFYMKDETKETSVVRIPDGIVSISENAFTQIWTNLSCPNYAAVEIPKSVKSFGKYAFKPNSNIYYLGTEEEWNAIEGSADYNVNVHFGSSAPEEVPNYFYETFDDHVEIVGCMKSAEEVIIPEKIDGLPVTKISGQFGDWEQPNLSLVSVTIPDSVTEIGDFAFYCCEKLETVNGARGVTSIGAYAFAGTPWLDTVTDENGCSVLNGILFSYGSEDPFRNYYIELPEGITQIGKCAFVGTWGTSAIIIPDGVEIIDDSAFYLMQTRLDYVVVPDSVTQIGIYSLADMHEIFYAGTEEQWNAIVKEDENADLDPDYEEYYNDYIVHFESTAPSTDYGDVDGVEGVTVDDASAILKEIAQLLFENGSFTEEQIWKADVDHDKALTPDDVSVILQYISQSLFDDPSESFFEWLYNF